MRRFAAPPHGRSTIVDQSSAELDRRIAKLESSGRRDRAIGLAMLALVFITAQAPAAPPSSAAPIVVRDASGASATLSALGLTVRDSAGHERTFVGIDSAKPSVDLSDATGHLRQSMYLLNDLPELRQFDATGKDRLEVNLDSKNDGEFRLFDKDAKLRLALFRTNGGDPQLGLYGTDEKLRAYFSTDDASPYFVMRDASQTDCVYVGGYTDGSIGMAVKNASNAVLWKAP
jgi:hypothetical protein